MKTSALVAILSALLVCVAAAQNQDGVITSQARTMDDVRALARHASRIEAVLRRVPLRADRLSFEVDDTLIAEGNVRIRLQGATIFAEVARVHGAQVILDGETVVVIDEQK